MDIVKGYYVLNMKMLLKDKISFIWSIFLPSSIFMFNRNIFNDVLDMRFYWGYIIFSSYVFGVGLHSLRLKEQGTLKTYFSIKESRFEFFIANVLTQITFTFIAIFFFNLFCSLLVKLNIVKMIIYSIILIIASLPVAFVFFWITIIKNIHYNSINTIVTIMTTVFMFMAQIDTKINYINPLIYISNILLIDSKKNIVEYITISILCVVVGVYSIKNYSIISNEVR